MLPAWLTHNARLVRLEAELALLARLDAGSGFTDSRAPAQLYLHDDAARERIAGGTLRPRGTHQAAIAAVKRELEAFAEPWTGTPVDLIIERFGLDEGAAMLIACAVVYAVDLDARELFHALAHRRPPALYVDACAALHPSIAPGFVEALLPGSRFRRARLVAVTGDGLGASIELTAHALAWLLGDDALQPPLTTACELHGSARDERVVLPPAFAAALDAIAPRLADHARIAVVLRGPRGSGRAAAAQRIAAALGRPRLAIAIPALVAAEKRTQHALLATALAAARLRDAIPYLADADALFDEAGRLAADHADALEHHGGALLAGTTGRGGHLDLRRPQLAVAVPRAELADREAAWRTGLAAARAPVDDAAELAARYVIGPGLVADVIAEASAHATAAAVSIDRDAIEAATQRRLALRIGTFGAVVARKARMAELVLPDDVVDTLRDMIAMVRERAQILERWGLQRHLGIARGVAALYSGEPGTGKTMAASVVASELGLELVRIDLSAVVSKYVGETEKNLAKIFDEAQDAHALLLFDEADSLFGKRTELKSAQDRFANLEINYILQRMETFDGVSVLTTNAESAIDPALQRRLNFRIRFPEPDVDERVKLWQQLLPPTIGLHGGTDFHALAERFDMTGGYIKNAVVRAAVIAARAGRAMIADDLWLGAHHEYVEMGKVMPAP
jgi:hypothetical protein